MAIPSNGARARARIHQLTRLLHATTVAISAGELTEDDTGALLGLGRELIDRIVQGARGDNGGGLSVITPVTRDLLGRARSALSAWTPSSGPKLALRPLSDAMAHLAPLKPEA